MKIVFSEIPSRMSSVHIFTHFTNMETYQGQFCAPEHPMCNYRFLPFFPSYTRVVNQARQGMSVLPQYMVHTVISELTLPLNF